MSEAQIEYDLALARFIAIFSLSIDNLAILKNLPPESYYFLKSYKISSLTAFTLKNKYLRSFHDSMAPPIALCAASNSRDKPLFGERKKEV